MPALKIYTTAEFRDSFIPRRIAEVIGTGPHRQAHFYIAGTTKGAASDRLRDLGERITAAKLRVVANVSRELAELLVTPGDYLAWTGGQDRPLVRVPADGTEPEVIGHWRTNPAWDRHRHGYTSRDVPPLVLRFTGERTH